ncbi:MAG TPA: hypothetical protein DEA80_17145 [Afipia sp.]|uniref:Uncharacterized protein n=1 Tax=Afipia broomeae ATCC 49717 TaxID=883078 RepID=K8P409_9BRAD|nr:MULTISPECIES: hypothetical protein [Afipia]MAH71001.1 hypothetical protein [Afipia sp.]OUX59930.1 MAG: hypothetical protein CBB64_17375 [Afipia sp. TMED4]EKS37262.1 hypothetical protein HMPREF9695_03680 [Afipia broomeae ATCC 49717]HAO40147.1 hypothetical protein [Afipia sp.]HAP13752.1 hypothetical protein [Afipia sp.]
MSIKTRIAALAVAAVALTGGIAATTQEAHAGKFHHHHGVGIGVGLAAGALFAAAASNAYAGDYYGYRRCGWVRQFDAYGNYIGRVRSCY